MKPKTPLSLTSAAYPGVTPKLVGLGDTAGEGCHFNPIFISHLHKNFQALPALSTHLSNPSRCPSERGLLLAQKRWLWVLMGDLVLDVISVLKQMTPCSKKPTAKRAQGHLSGSRGFYAFLWLSFTAWYKPAAPGAAGLPPLPMEPCSHHIACSWGCPTPLPSNGSTCPWSC